MVILDPLWGAAGICRTGSLSGVRVWVFLWTRSDANGGEEVLAYELRLCVDADSPPLQAYEYLFVSRDDVEDFAFRYGIEWLPLDAAQRIIEGCFPREAGAIRDRSG